MSVSVSVTVQHRECQSTSPGDRAESLPDFALLARCREGDRAALSALIQRHHGTVERMLRRFRVDESERADLVQDALLQVVDKAHTFRGDAQFSTWLYRVATNAALMRLRSRRRKGADSLDAIEERADELLAAHPWHDGAALRARGDEQLHRRQQQARIERALETLPEAYRELVLGHYLGDEPLQELADRLGTTESAVRSRLHRARRMLRDELVGVEIDQAAAA